MPMQPRGQYKKSGTKGQLPQTIVLLPSYPEMQVLCGATGLEHAAITTEAMARAR